MGPPNEEEFEMGNGMLVNCVVLIALVSVSRPVPVPMLHVGRLEVTPGNIVELVEFPKDD